jgi:transcriptional regulator with XRE-family HTH domain
MSPSCIAGQAAGRTADHAANLRRLLAQQGLTVDQLSRRSGLDRRTLRGILQGAKHPQPRTLHRLAAGLGVPVDELFQCPALLIHRRFDRQTNPVVARFIETHGEMFRDWSEAEFDELYSRFGHGGALTDEGARQAAEAMNRRRQVQQRVALILETAEADLLEAMVEALYRRVCVTEGTQGRTPSPPRHLHPAACAAPLGAADGALHGDDRP